MLSLENLSCKIDDKYLFHKLSLTLLSGSISVIRGPNGSGKTTLLRLLAGISPLQSGRILINGIDSSLVHKPYANYIGHNLAIKLELTVLENIMRAAEAYNSLERVEAAIYYFNLMEFIEIKCYQLSAGNRKKVALCRLLACNAKIWLLDEAETNLDEENRKLLANSINMQAASGGIIISTTHQLSHYLQGSEINLEDFQI